MWGQWVLSESDAMTETWKDIPGYEGRYQVSDLGRVKSLPSMQRYLLRNGAEAYRRTAERVLVAHPQNSGYPLVQLWRDNQRAAFTVHRLVAQAFIPNPDSLPEVNHRDGVKANCRADNLEWCTRSANKLHAIDAGLSAQARRVLAPGGREYPSGAQAARGERVAHRTAAKWTCP